VPVAGDEVDVLLGFDRRGARIAAVLDDRAAVVLGRLVEDGRGAAGAGGRRDLGGADDVAGDQRRDRDAGQDADRKARMSVSRGIGAAAGVRARTVGGLGRVGVPARHAVIEPPRVAAGRCGVAHQSVTTSVSASQVRWPSPPG
jgi:hypothetical protein